MELITPLPLTGVAGAKLFAHYALKPNVIYIDGDHEFDSVLADLRGLARRMLAPGGLLLGDDYQWPGVRQAVDEACAGGRVDVRAAGEQVPPAPHGLTGTPCLPLGERCASTSPCTAASGRGENGGHAARCESFGHDGSLGAFANSQAVMCRIEPRPITARGSR